MAHISNFNFLKRAMDVARSAEKALKKNPSLLYLFVGDGGDRPLIEAKFRDLGLSERSRFPGWVPYGRIHEYYRLAAITVMPAEDETQARAYLEAQACGCVLIASDIPAAREVVVDGETGVLFPKGNIDALTELTVSLAVEPARRAALGRKARAAMSRHGLDDAVLSYLKMFNSTLAVSKASRE
jgi:glycosyltransferase involved in cell wall biosynthesis